MPGTERQSMENSPYPTHHNDNLNAPAAARYLGLATASLAKMRCIGGSPTFMRLGRTIVYSRADLDEWLNARRARNTIEGDRLPKRLTDDPRAGREASR